MCMKKHLKYNLAIILSTIDVLGFLVGGVLVLWGILSGRQALWSTIGTVIIAICLICWYPLRQLRVDTRRDVEYDEFGRSKSKGNYEYLSKKERDQIDLKKTSDMERLLSTTALKKMTKPGSTTPMEDLHNMIGLEPVKTKIEEMVARMEFEQAEIKSHKKKKKDLGVGSMGGRHCCYTGSPGTGKTTIARIYTGFLYKYGYIKENKCVEIDGNFLKAGTESALKTELVIRAAYGGVLFIDEAYALMDSGDGSGEQVIATLIKQMEDNRDKFILIIAGYTNEMKRLIDQNPGFESRIKEYLDFPDYNAVEMREIAQSMARTNNFVIDEKAFDVFDGVVERERKLRSFGNGRTVRNILDKAIDKHTLNLAKQLIDPSKRYVLMPLDFQNLQLGTIKTNTRDYINSF